ncbi:MAG: hypothetical protein V1918_04175 [Planctomycetota bacterium]
MRPGNWAFELLLALGCLWLAAARPAAAEDDPLARRIDLDLRGKTVLEAVRQLNERGKIDLLIGRDIADSKSLLTQLLSVEMRDTTLRGAVEWVARALGTRYRLEDGGRTVEFTSSYAWLEKEPIEIQYYNIGGLAEVEEAAAFLAQIKELLKVYAMRSQQYALILRASDFRLQANFPSVLHARLALILRAMAYPGRVPRSLKSEAPLDARRLEEALSAHVRCNYEEVPLPEVLADLSFQADVNLGFDQVALSGRPYPLIRLHAEEEALADVLVKVGEQAGLEGSLFDPPYGVWLTEEPPLLGRSGSRELLWTDVPVAGYAVRPLAREMGGEVLALLVKKSIPLDVRSDPSMGVIYHERSGNLVVVAPAEVQESVERFLARLLEEQELEKIAHPPSAPPPSGGSGE